MNRAKYPNRNALDQALKLYLDAMCLFVSECLDEQSIRKTLRLLSSDNLREKMEVRDIATLISENWSRCFKTKFKIFDREYTRYYDACSVTSLIIEGRNQLSHQWLRELDPEFTRSQLFLIAEVLGKIKRPDAQREVERVRDGLFDNTTEQLVAIVVEAEKAVYEKAISELEKRLAAEKEKNKELLEQLNDKDVKLSEKTEELQKLSERHLSMKLSKQESEKQPNSISNQLEKGQTAHSACEERITAISDQRTAAEAERLAISPDGKTTTRREKRGTTSDQMQEFAIKAAEFRNAHLRPGAAVKSWKNIGDEIGISRSNRYILRESDEYRDAIIAAIKEAAERGFEDVEIPKNLDRQFGYLGDPAPIAKVIAHTFKGKNGYSQNREN